MHTLIAGSEDKDRHEFLERLLERSGVTVPLCGFRTTMSAEDLEGNAKIHIHPISGDMKFLEENLVGLCKNRHSEVYPEVFEKYLYLLENPPRGGLVVMDGIGPMEGAAPRFRESVLKALDGDIPVLATVRDKDTEFLLAVRKHPKVRCFVLGGDDEKLFLEALEFFAPRITNAAPS